MSSSYHPPNWRETLCKMLPPPMLRELLLESLAVSCTTTCRRR